MSRIQREYEQEVAQSRKLQKEARPSVPVAPVASASAPASSEESQKDHASLSLYEDLTGLTMLNVRIRKGASGKEVLYSCMQTTDGRSELYLSASWFNSNPQALRSSCARTTSLTARQINGPSSSSSRPTGCRTKRTKSLWTASDRSRRALFFRAIRRRRRGSSCAREFLKMAYSRTRWRLR